MLELLVQTNTGTSNLASTVVTFSNNNVAGNSIIVACGNTSGTASDVSGVTDTQGNVYIKILATANALIGELEIWYTAGIKAGANIITVAYTTGVSCAVIAREYYGTIYANTIDKSASNTGNSTSLSSGATTPITQNIELVVGAGVIPLADTFTAGAGFVNLTTLAAPLTIIMAMEDLYVISGGAQTATFGSNAIAQWVCGVATFFLSPTGTTTSTSSTSISSTSISTTSVSSTSSSVSTSSTSTSTTTFSTSSTSSSTSTSSTSSSTSSTSSSTSSTSISSTSSSTSISSTSTSLTTFSTSSTSISSTSSSTSISSTSSSISSTSSSISSTSISMSSTSFSSTSSSSSTSTTTFPPPIEDFDAQDSIVLATTAADLLSDLNAYQVSNLSTDDGDYFIQKGSKYTALHFQLTTTSNSQNINVMWKGRSTESSIRSPIYLQIFNLNSSQWETLAYDNTKPADTDYILSGSITVNLSNYYDSNFQVTCRIYQQVI